MKVLLLQQLRTGHPSSDGSPRVSYELLANSKSQQHTYMNITHDKINNKGVLLLITERV